MNKVPQQSDQRSSDLRSTRGKVSRRCFLGIAISATAVALASCTSTVSSSPTQAPATPSAGSAPQSSSSSALQKPDAYKFGAVLILSGGSAIVGENMQKGVEAALEDINGAGGINGVPMKVIYEDGQARAKESVDALNKLISVDKVPATIMTSSAGVLASAPIATREHILMLNPGAQSPKVTGASPYLFSVIITQREEASVMLKYLRSKNLSRLALYGQNDDLGHDMDAFFKTQWPQLGGTYVGGEFHDNDAVDHSSAIAKLKSWNPDVVFLASGGRAQATFIKQAGEQGLKVQIASYGTLITDEMLQIAGKYAEGAIATAQSQNLDPTSNPMAKRFLDTYQKKYGAGKPNYYTVLCYDATYVLRDAIEWTVKNNRPYNGDALREAILTIREFNGSSGKTVFRDDGSSSRAVDIWQVKDGKFNLIETVAPRG